MEIPSATGKGVVQANLTVVYSVHCYSTGKDVENTGHRIYDGRTTRFFSLERYQLSLRLPEVIQLLATEEKCFFTAHRNFFIIQTEDNKEFRVFFSIKKTGKSELKVYIESAYFPETFTQKKGAIKGYLLLAKTLRGERIKKPSV
jgi:hypothetical protein